MQINTTAGSWPYINIRTWREEANNRWYYLYAITMSRWGSGMRLARLTEYAGGGWSHPGFATEADAVKELIHIMQQNMVNSTKLTSEEKTIFVQTIKKLKNAGKSNDVCLLSTLSR